MIGDLGYERDILQRREARDEIVELEDETDVLAAEASQRNVARRGEVVVEIVDLAAGRHIQARQEC